MHRILLADDDELTLHLLEEVLSSPGRTFRQASSGAELARAIAEEEPFDVIVSDVRMPWVNGLSVALSAQRAGVRSRFIFVTGCDPDALAAPLSQLRNVRLLSKPVRVEDLCAAVDAALAA